MALINIDLPFLLPEGSPIPQIFPRLSAAVETVAQTTLEIWTAWAEGAPMPDGRKIPVGSGDYARSIQRKKLGDLSWRIESDSPEAEKIENGTPAYDMKVMLRTSTKVRLNKNGGRYLIIPFRHGSPGAVTFKSQMTGAVYEAAKALTPSHIKSTFKAPNAIGFHSIDTRELITVTRRRYHYGDKLPAGLASKTKPSHKTDPFSGMRRFDRPGGGGHSQFITFRTMSDKLSGWIKAAIPGFRPTFVVAEQLRPKAEKLFKEALEQDLNAILGQS